METIKKVVYFDESTAFDFLQIETKGKLTRTTELMSTMNSNAKGEASGSVNVGKSGAVKAIFDKFVGIGVSMDGTIGASGNFQGEKIARTILENSVLYDFIDTVELRRKKPLVDITSDYALEISRDSMSYFAMIAPISEMMEGNQVVDGMDDVTMSVSKLNVGIRGMMGYFELIGRNMSGEIERIFRFNINSFKNNYRIQDLAKMNLTLYSIKVGKTKLSDLDFMAKFNPQNNNLSFSGITDNLETENEKEFPVFDVILAGVK